MKPGDLVELKEGTFGLRGDDRYAIFLERTKHKKQYLATLHTTKGRKEASIDAVRRVVLKARVDDPLSMEAEALTARLKELRQEVGRAKGQEETKAERDLERLDDRRLWERVVNDLETLTPEEAANHLFAGKANKDQVRDVRAILQTCQTLGVGYFERTGGRGERYKPYTVDEIKAARRDIDGLRKLRNRIIHVEEVEDPETGELETLIEGIALDEAGLDGEDRARLELLGRYMASFVLHDEDAGEVGLGGTPIHTLDGFTLFRFARFLAFDWLGPTSASISGAFVRFLVETRLLDVREAVVLVAQRHVLASDHMAWTYPERVLREAERFEGTIPAAWREGREDLTGLETYTIDPPDAKDFDDAISIVVDGDDTLLHVHIADVAQYVEKGSGTDHEARSRGTSTYLPTGVLPMLPPRLADDLCSLKAGQERPALTAVLRVGPDGAIEDAAFHESIIHVDRNLSYDTVNEEIPRGTEPFASLHALARRMNAQRRGLALETDELKVHIDSEAVDPHLKSGSNATRMIEQFMVAANEAVARHLTAEGVPVPYRCHPLPDRASVHTFNKRMEVMEQPFRIELPEPSEDEAAPEEADEEDGASFLEALKGGKVQLVGGGFIPDEEDEDEEALERAGDEDDETDAPSGAPILKGLAQLPPEEQDAWLAPFREVLDALGAIADPRLRVIIQWKLLSCMGRAVYTPENMGHFGLGSTCYLHFTSPIRRYPDLVTHRQLKWWLAGAEGKPPHSAQELAELSPLNTDQSVEAERLERTLINVALAFEARTEKWRGAHSARVNGITKGGVFLSLERGVEARLATSEIPGGPWSVDEAEAMLFRGSLDDPTIGTVGVEGQGWRELYNEDLDEMVRVRLVLGDELTVSVVDQDLVDGRIRCRLAGGAEPEA